MEVKFADGDLRRLEIDAEYTAGFGRPVIRGFRKVMAVIRAAIDERAFYKMTSLHYEKLKGNRQHERSMRINRQFRLILQIDKGDPVTAVIIQIEDYH